jgi:hypothetical protein
LINHEHIVELDVVLCNGVTPNIITYDPMHSEKAFEVTGEWFRWSQYEIRDGIIVPALASPVVYDPWKTYRENVGKYRTVEQPYVALLELQRGLEQAGSRGVLPSYIYSTRSVAPVSGARNEADEMILQWCNSHGLLGLLSTLCSSICMPAVVKRLPRRNMRLVTQLVHFRDGGRWCSGNNIGDPLTGSTSKLADAAARSEVRNRPEPGANWLDRSSHVYEWRPLETIREFFPSLSRRVGKAPFNPPRPNQHSFWAEYGEPAQQFMLWCRLFTRAVEHLSRWEADPKADDLAWETIALDRAFRTLSGLAQSAAPAFRFNRGRNILDEARDSAGLLGSYALMFLWDLMEGRRVLSCQTCGRYFVSNDRRALYCRVSCRNTAQSRRSRAKKR